MKSKLIALILSLGLATSVAFGHGDIALGPNGGRILEFSKNATMYGEVIHKDGKFHIALLDKDKKAVDVADQILTATGGTREKPEKLTVEKTAAGFVVAAVKPGQWLILQFKADEKAKAITARLEYDTSNCDACDSPEWLCKCSQKKEQEANAKKKAK
ncbi:MAG: hypothetical protein ACKV19_23790 [Verrucomicrobiales bacterium]